MTQVIGRGCTVILSWVGISDIRGTISQGRPVDAQLRSIWSTVLKKHGNEGIHVYTKKKKKKLYFNNLLHFFSIHFKIHDIVGY